MNRNRSIQIFCVVVAALCVLLAALMTPFIDAQRRELQLDAPPELGGKQSAEMVLLGAAGAFRGLAINFMWYRVERLKQEGKFFEINQLAQGITTLQPRFAEVWRYHAWNMAYNISVATHTPDERWDWVNKGIRLLRDKGILYNPRAVNLYRELSWIFYHKVGQYSDDMHWYYKRKLAYEWQEILGAPTRGATAAEAAAAFNRIATAPDTAADLIRDHPDVGRLLARLTDLGAWPTDNPEPLTREIGRIFMFNYLAGDSLVGQTVEPLPGLYRPELVAVLQDPSLGPSLPPLLAYLRKQVLLKTYHMDPAYMHRMMEVYGPIDWRHPAAQGAYWSEKGMDIAEGLRTLKGLDLLNTNRSTIHAMQELAATGDITFDPRTGYLDLSPDSRFIPAYMEAVKLALERLEKAGESEDNRDFYAAGQENFLLRAITVAYLYGDVEQARDYYRQTREMFGDRPDNIRSGRYTRTLDETVQADLMENLDNWDRTLQFIDAMIYTAMSKGLARRRFEVFERFMGFARDAHQKFSARALADPRVTQARMSIGSFEQVVVAGFAKYMVDPNNDLLERMHVWANGPLDLEQVVYDQVAGPLKAQAEAVGMPFDLAFPEPPGMAEIRRQRPTQPGVDQAGPGAGTIQRQ